MSQRKTTSRSGSGARGARGAGRAAANFNSAAPGHRLCAKLPSSSRATGASPKAHPGRDSKERPRQNSCPYVESSDSHSSLADPSSGSDDNCKGNERKNDTSRPAGNKRSSIRRAAGDQGSGSSRAAGGTSRDTGDKSRAAGGTSRDTGDKSRAAGGTSRDTGDKSRAAGGTSRDTGDKSRAAGDKRSSTRRAAGDFSRNGTGTSRAAGDQGTSSSRALGNTGGGKDRNLNKVLRNVVENLRIRSAQKSRASKQVNEVVDHLLRYIKKDPAGCFAAIAKLASGSYYENVKISEPNEFDIMITVPVKRIDFMEVDSEGAFYQVAFKRNPGTNPLSQFVYDGTLSAEEMICHLRKLIREAAKTLSGYNIKVERKKPGSPAVTLQIEDKEHGAISLDMVLALEVHSQSWPGSTADGLKIEDWLGKKVRKDFRMEPFYLVPKQPLDVTQGTRNQSHKEMWRISFSHIEKKMLLNHGNLKTCCENGSPKCCRKSCLKLLKNLIQKLKGKNPRILANVCSYHAKTTLLHACVKRPKDEMWTFEDLDICFLQLLDDFVKHLQATNLPHFFIPTYNLFQPRLFDSKCREALLRLIETERNKDFPIFSRPN
ncbi:cyclic GMP-AMP synthase [Carcharodon carcharias]|uniref:cyclic GMP-AMP synthase n=1 Tax=Carcharodon carcharias TaxID=13397 RepID=UPI001B7E527F|nr:cyclic GMP-AMP synthase [Carcharodon carcharias]